MRQPNPWRAVAVLAFVAMAALIPCVVEYSDSELAYYAGYNRLGAAFLFLTQVWILTPLKPSSPQALLVAYLLFMLLATKVTFFVAGFSILVVYGALTPFIRPLLWEKSAGAGRCPAGSPVRLPEWSWPMCTTLGRWRQ